MSEFAETGDRVTLIDSNVLLDVLTDDPIWFEWSSAALARGIDDGTVVINPIVYAEVSVGFDSIELLDELLGPEVFPREQLPYAAGFLAGKAFLRYRRSGGMKRSPLPDFYIGAHAAVRGYRLLSRDAKRFRSYFPSVDLISPTDPAAPS